MPSLQKEKKIIATAKVKEIFLRSAEMIGRTNRPESEITRRINSIRASTEMTFRGLLKAGEFDIRSELRFRNLSGLSFAGEDLRGIDFRGANLVGCSFEGARIEGARFEHARLGRIESGKAVKSDLTKAADWNDYVQANMAHHYQCDLLPEQHLPDWTVFMDSPLLPLMAVLPNKIKPPGSKARIATSITIVEADHCHAFAAMCERSNEALPEISLAMPRLEMTSRAAQIFITWARTLGAFHYRAPFADENELLMIAVDLDRSNSSNLFDRRMWAAERHSINDWKLSDGYSASIGGYGSVRLVRELA